MAVAGVDAWWRWGTAAQGAVRRAADVAVTWLTGGALAALLAAPPALAVPFALERTVPHPLPVASDLFGTSLALSGGRLLVGAPYRDAGTVPDAGVVFAFDLATGSLVATLAAPATAAGARLGSAIAAAGDVVLVGAPHEDGGAPHAGAVHRFDVASGAHRAVLPNPAPGFDDAFGVALAARGDGVVAGAQLDGARAADAGAAWVLRADGTVRLTLAPPDAAAYDLVGAAVASTGEYVVVGAPSDDRAQPNGGAVHVFDAGSGALLRTLVPGAPARGDQFGRALAVQGTLLLVGAPLDDVDAATDAGSVSVFDLTTGSRLARCTAPEPQTGAALGSAVAWWGTAIVAGAPFEDGAQPDAGGAWVLDAACTVLAHLENPAPGNGDQFGSAIAADAATRIAVAAWRDDVGSVDQAGAVHVFVDTGIGPPAVTTTTTIAGTTTSWPGSTTTTVTTTSTLPAEGTSSTLAPLPPPATTVPPDGTAPASTTTVPTTLPTIPEVTTTTRPGDAGGCVTSACDDGDPCTLDACDAGACRSEPLAGWEAVDCRLARLEDAFASGGVGALGTRRAARAAGLLATVRAQVTRGRARPATRARRPLRRAGRALAAFTRAVQRATPRGASPGPVTVALVATARGAGEALERLWR